MLPKKDLAPEKCQRLEDMLSNLSRANAQLLVAEKAQPLQFADPGHDNTPHHPSITYSEIICFCFISYMYTLCHHFHDTQVLGRQYKDNQQP